MRLAEARGAKRRDRLVHGREVVTHRAASEELQADAEQLGDPRPVDVAGEMEVGEMEAVGKRPSVVAIRRHSARTASRARWLSRPSVTIASPREGSRSAATSPRLAGPSLASASSGRTS